MERAFGLLLTLQERARNHGFEHSDWANLKRLGEPCLPETWFDRTGKAIDQQKTYDGGCQVCGWSSPKENLLLRMVEEEHTHVTTANTSPKRTRVDAFPEDDAAGDGSKMPRLDYHVCFVEDDDSDAGPHTPPMLSFPRRTQLLQSLCKASESSVQPRRSRLNSTVSTSAALLRDVLHMDSCLLEWQSRPTPRPSRLLMPLIHTTTPTPPLVGHSTRSRSTTSWTSLLR